MSFKAGSTCMSKSVLQASTEGCLNTAKFSQTMAYSFPVSVPSAAACFWKAIPLLQFSPWLPGLYNLNCKK